MECGLKGGKSGISWWIYNGTVDEEGILDESLYVKVVGNKVVNATTGIVSGIYFEDSRNISRNYLVIQEYFPDEVGVAFKCRAGNKEVNFEVSNKDTSNRCEWWMGVDVRNLNDKDRLGITQTHICKCFGFFDEIKVQRKGVGSLEWQDLPDVYVDNNTFIRVQRSSSKVVMQVKDVSILVNDAYRCVGVDRKQDYQVETDSRQFGLMEDPKIVEMQQESQLMMQEYQQKWLYDVILLSCGCLIIAVMIGVAIFTFILLQRERKKGPRIIQAKTSYLVKEVVVSRRDDSQIVPDIKIVPTMTEVVSGQQ